MSTNSSTYEGPAEIKVTPSKFTDGTPTVTLRLRRTVIQLPITEALWLAEALRVAGIEALPD